MGLSGSIRTIYLNASIFLEIPFAAVSAYTGLAPFASIAFEENDSTIAYGAFIFWNDIEGLDGFLII